MRAPGSLSNRAQGSSQRPLAASGAKGVVGYGLSGRRASLSLQPKSDDMAIADLAVAPTGPCSLREAPGQGLGSPETSSAGRNGKVETGQRARVTPGSVVRAQRVTAPLT